MRFFIRTTKGLGNATVYARLRNSSGYFWDFVGLSWVTPITVNCKLFLPEYADNDTLESIYMGSASIPAGGPWIQEAVNDSTDSVYGSDDTVMGELTGAPNSSSSFQEKMEYVFQYLAFKRTASTVKENLFNEAGTVSVVQADLSDDGTTFTKTKAI
jgi:hypothetical protein